MMLGVALLWMVWLALTGSLAVPSVIAGFVCVLVVIALWRILTPTPSLSAARLFLRPVRAVRFALTLARRFVLSTIRTSWLILRGGEEGRMLAIPIRVDDTLARFILLSSITLTPSTIALLVEDDLLYIHWLQPSGGHGDWRAIKESLEERLLRLFEGDDRGHR